jgi:N-acetylglucosamine malate deacetylase 1
VAFSERLVISVHPDDETLGCGGTILRHCAAGDNIHWLVVTQPVDGAVEQSFFASCAKQVEDVAAAYGVSSVTKLGFPTARLDTVSQADLIARIGDVISERRPETVYLVHAGDVHTDHHAVFLASMSVLKSFHMRSLGVRRVLSYETLSSTEAAPAQNTRAFLPTVYNDITPYVDRKIEIMGLYHTESQADPLPRGPSAIRALARFRGATVGLEYAEAFMLIREVA